MERLTIKDIAKALNVSISTVSKALSDSYEISATTKDRVIKYAEENNYYPNQTAKNLKKGKTNTIGVIIGDIANSFMAQLLDGIHTSFMNKGMDILIMQSQHTEQKEKQCIEFLINKGVDGILISPVKENSNLELLTKIQKHYPIVIFDRIQSDLATHKVGVNNIDGGFRATQHLLRIGKKNILMILAEGLGVSQLRLEGFQKALRQYKMPINEDNILYVNLQDNDVLDKKVKEFIEKKLKSKNPPDAVICASEIISMRTLGVLAEAGIKVPTDIAVVGFANTNFAFSLNPPLTTIVQPAFEIGKMATLKMIELLNKPTNEYELIEFDTDLVIRKSSGY